MWYYKKKSPPVGAGELIIVALVAFQNNFFDAV